MSIGFSGSLVFKGTLDYGQAGLPQIGYDNVLTLTTTALSASFAEPEHPVQLAVNGYTNDSWIGSANTTQTITAELASARPVNYIGIAAHNLEQSNLGFRLLYSQDAWATEVDVTGWIKPPTDSPVMVVFDEVSAPSWRIEVSAGTAAPYIGVIYVGRAVKMERGIEPSWAPIALARDSEVVNNISVGGNFLGRSLIRQGASGSITLDNLTPAWVRSEWKGLQNHAERLPFFFGWALEDYPWEVAYCWSDGPLQTPRYTKPAHMSVSMKLKGLN